MLHKRILTLWPAFITAALATTCFFSVFDPHELSLHGARLFEDKLTAYSVFFLIAWGFGSLNAALILLLAREERDINGFAPPPVDPDARYDPEPD